MSEVLLTVAGANRQVLAEAPKERTKQVAMGAVLVSVASLAVAAASYALVIALHSSLPWALVGGAVWGLIILNMDRWLVVSSPRLRSKIGTLGMALPRVLLAVLIGAVVSTPLTLAVFSSEINVELERMSAESENAFAQQLDSDSRFADIGDKRQQIAGLQADIADGVTDADVRADPAVVDLQARVDQARLRYDDAAAAVQCENDGTCGTGDRGVGDVSLAKMAERDRLQGEWQALDGQLTALVPEVRTQLEAEEATRTADQQATVDRLQGEVDAAETQRSAAIASHDAEQENSGGILARLSALERIQDRDPVLGTAHLLLFLFLTALECLPIFFKTMLALAPPSLYERLMTLDEERVEARARLRQQTEYEEAETMARAGIAAAEARAARTLEAESKATGMVLDAQLAVTRDSVRRWKDDQRSRFTASGPAPGTDQALLTALEEEMAGAGRPSAPPAT
ncbi:DUF4407 domain-containing protein [Klenkia brasiliensis]|uniref:DUF4407 domain-containing protein n=1 Tax=Klenkia brasiliensis TaxID=333142 RepID=UPI0013F60459|nr:DUF4407 domain-containing protein [Klenkia brasiliensis]